MIWPFKKRTNPIFERIDKLQAVSIQRDDVIIVSAKQILTDNQKREIESLMRLKLGLENKLVIFDEGISMGILRP